MISSFKVVLAIAFALLLTSILFLLAFGMYIPFLLFSMSGMSFLMVGLGIYVGMDEHKE